MAFVSQSVHCMTSTWRLVLMNVVHGMFRHFQTGLCGNALSMGPVSQCGMASFNLAIYLKCRQTNHKPQMSDKSWHLKGEFKVNLWLGWSLCIHDLMCVVTTGSISTVSFSREVSVDAEQHPTYASYHGCSAPAGYFLNILFCCLMYCCSDPAMLNPRW